MHELKKNLFGYRQEDVDQYFQSYERETQIAIRDKYTQLDDMKDNIQHSKLKIKATIKKIEALNQKKEEIFNSFVKQLNDIEESLKTNQAEAQNYRLSALNKLQEKINEVEEWMNLLRQCYMDILAVQGKYQYVSLENK